MVAAAGLDDVELLEGAWDQLEGQFRTIGASAQKRALAFAGRIVGGFDTDARRDYGLRQAADLDEAWDWTKENLTALAKTRLYTPDLADPELGEFDPTSRTPTGLVRQAMRRAGGVKGSANLAQISTAGGDDGANAWISVPDGSAPGGIATGQLIEDIVKGEGGSVPGYRWVYGPADRRHPFHPHLALDGLVFASFTDPRLVIGGGFPTTGHYIPGDHRGCICDVEPIFLTPEQVAQLRAQGYLPEVPDLPGAEAPAAKPPRARPDPADELMAKLGEPSLLRARRRQLADAQEFVTDRRKLLAAERKRVAKAVASIEDDLADLPEGSEQWRIKRLRADNLQADLQIYERMVVEAEASVERATERLAEAEGQWAARKDEAVRLYRLQREPMPAGLSARSTDEWLAERWGEQLGGAQRTISTAKLGKVNGPKVGKVAHELMQRYTATAERLLRFGDSATVTSATRRDIGGAFRIPTLKRAWADAWDQPGGKWIRMGPATADAQARQWAVMGPANVANGFHPPGGDTIESVFTHEFGHHVHYEALAKAKANGVEDRWRAQLADIKSRHLHAKGYDQTSIAARALVKSEVSEYALKNEFELFAEAFSYVETMGDQASPLAKDLHRLVVDWAEGNAAELAAEGAEAARAGTRVS
jgi:hypothetical protein